MLRSTTLGLAALALCLSLVPVTAAAQPTPRALQFGPGLDTQALDMTVVGDTRCREVTGFRCHGWVYHHPVEIVVSRPARVQIETTHSSVDTVLALVGPSGSFADDDGHGERSRLDLVLEPGVHYLYVGPRHRRHVGNARVMVSSSPLRRSPPVVVVPSRPSPPHVVHLPAPRVVARPPERRHHPDDDRHGERGRRGRSRHDHD